MSVSPEAKLAQASADREAAIAKLEGEVNVGRSAERLVVNQDWQRIKGDILKLIREMESKRLASYESVVTQAVTTDQKMVALDYIRNYSQTIRDWNFFITLPDSEVLRGRQAEEELAKIREGGAR